MSNQPYATDLTDAEWAILSSLIPEAKPGGHPRTVNMRSVCNAIYYQLKTGCQWHLLPHDFPPSSTVYFYYRRWQRHGLWERMNHALREQLRQKLGKAAHPSALATDSQSVKTAEKRGRSMALMGAKK
jgi:putative transposase